MRVKPMRKTGLICFGRGLASVANPRSYIREERVALVWGYGVGGAGCVDILVMIYISFVVVLTVLLVFL